MLNTHSYLTWSVWSLCMREIVWWEGFLSFFFSVVDWLWWESRGEGGRGGKRSHILSYPTYLSMRHIHQGKMANLHPDSHTQNREHGIFDYLESASPISIWTKSSFSVFLSLLVSSSEHIGPLLAPYPSSEEEKEEEERGNIRTVLPSFSPFS